MTLFGLSFNPVSESCLQHRGRVASDPWGMKLLLFLMPALLIAGCSRRNLSRDELEALIPGSQVIQADSMHYAFEGNHAGYFIVLQGRVPAEAIEELISSSDHEPESFYADVISDYRDSFSRRFRNLRMESSPEWFDFDPSPASQKFRLRGSNAWTSEFLYDVIYDPGSGTLWLEGGGI